MRGQESNTPPCLLPNKPAHDASEAYACEVGMAGVVLSTESSMHAAAHRLCEHRGFTRETNRDWEVRGFMLLAYRRSL